MDLGENEERKVIRMINHIHYQLMIMSRHGIIFGTWRVYQHGGKRSPYSIFIEIRDNGDSVSVIIDFSKPDSLESLTGTLYSLAYKLRDGFNAPGIGQRVQYSSYDPRSKSNEGKATQWN